MIKTWLAFDIGTMGAKVAVVNDTGQILRSVTRDYPTHTAPGGIVEQNAANWWNAAVDASCELDARSTVEAVALTGQMQNAILIDHEGDPVRPVILYSDTRARAEAQHINTILSSDRLHELTGNEQDADSLLAKLNWLKMHEPESLKASHRLLLGAADYLAHRMVGVAATDSTTASTTGLMNLHTRAILDTSVFQELGLEACAQLLPPITPGGTQIGQLTDSAAAALRLKPGIPVFHGPGDAGTATLGAGCGEIGMAYAYLGTSGWIAFTAPDRAVPDRGVITLAHPNPERYIHVAPLLTAGGNLEWVRNLFNTPDYDSLITGALGRQPTNLIYLPYLNGERSPFRDPLARGAFVGLNTSSTQYDLYRAVLEGVVYAYRHVLDVLMPASTSTLTVTGGGTRSKLWCQLFSDIIHMPVAILADAGNVGVRGAVLAAQVANDERIDYVLPGLSPVDETLNPDTFHSAHYDRKYQLFRDTYVALQSIFARMS